MLATRDAVMASRTGSLSTYYVTSDNDVIYRVIGPAGPDWIFAQSEKTGILIAVLRTGHKPVRGRGDQVRVQIFFGRDTNDIHGTLTFDRADGVEMIGGVAPRVLFA